MGFPDRSAARVCVGASSDRHLDRALTDTQLASEKSIVVMDSSEVPRLDAISARPHHAPQPSQQLAPDRACVEEP